MRRNTKVHPANLDLSYKYKNHLQTNNNYRSRYNNNYNNRYDNRYDNRYHDRKTYKYASTHDYTYNTNMNDYYQNSKEAYANIKRKELDNYMVKFLKTPEYNKYVRNLSDSDSEKMNKALVKNYSYSLSRPLSYSNTIYSTHQNNYNQNYSQNYNQNYSNNYFRFKRKKRW